LCLAAQQSPQQVVLDRDADVHTWQVARVAEHLRTHRYTQSTQLMHSQPRNWCMVDTKLPTPTLYEHRAPSQTSPEYLPVPSWYPLPSSHAHSAQRTGHYRHPMPFHSSRSRTWPTNRSARVRVGSIWVPMPIRPPGTAISRSLFSAYRDRMRVYRGVHLQCSAVQRRHKGHRKTREQREPPCAKWTEGPPHHAQSRAQVRG
jgi:hypothetical protein